MIDAAIPLAGRAPEITPLMQQLTQAGNLQLQQGQLQAQQQEAEQRGLQTQGQKLVLAGQQQSAQDEADVRAGMAAGMKTDPTTGQVTFDRTAALNTIGKLNPTKGQQLATTFAQQDTAAAEAKAKLDKAQIDAATAHVDFVDKALQGVTDQASYTNALQQAIQTKIVKPGELPEVYDPQLVARLHAQALSQKETLAAHVAQQTADAKDDKAPKETPPEKAMAIYAIPVAQRSPDQIAFIKGYEKNNDVTRIQPAQVRIQALMQMPQAVVDPNDPSKTVFTTKKGAIGMEAPSSGEAAGARKVLTSAIGGKLGDTINSYNTANAHLDMLSTAADALYNGNTQLLNKVGNEFNKQTGSPAPTNFQAVKSAVAGEVSKTFKGGQATDAEIKQFDDAISSANSPKQLQGVIKTYKGLMNSKRDAIKTQVEQGTQGKVNFGGESGGVIRARDPQGNLHQAPAGTPLPAGWKVE